MSKEPRDIGLGIEAPVDSCDGITDENDPFCGTISLRGRTFEGEVVSAKMEDTVIVEWEYQKSVPKYERYERRRTRVAAHNPQSVQAREGDRVVIAECRPISKTKSFVVVHKEEAQ